LTFNNYNSNNQYHAKSRDVDFYVDSGSSTGPLSSNSSTNNDSLSSNVSSSESDCESQQFKYAKNMVKNYNFIKSNSSLSLAEEQTYGYKKILIIKNNKFNINK